MASTKTSVEFNAPIQKAFDVIADFESYPEFLPETKEVIVEKKTPKSVRVTFKIRVLKKIAYTLDLKLDSPKKISWQLVEGEMMKKNSGSWTLSESKKGITIADYEIDIDFGGLVPKMISDKLVGVNLPSMMKAFRERIEGSM